MLVTAAFFYLPNHVALIYNRICFYVRGTGNGNAVAQGVAQTAKRAVSSVTPETTRILNEL